MEGAAWQKIQAASGSWEKFNHSDLNSADDKNDLVVD